MIGMRKLHRYIAIVLCLVLVCLTVVGQFSTVYAEDSVSENSEEDSFNPENELLLIESEETSGEDVGEDLSTNEPEMSQDTATSTIVYNKSGFIHSPKPTVAQILSKKWRQTVLIFQNHMMLNHILRLLMPQVF